MAEWMPLHHDPEEEETPQASQKDRRLEQLSVQPERVQATVQESRMSICQWYEERLADKNLKPFGDMSNQSSIVVAPLKSKRRLFSKGKDKVDILLNQWKSGFTVKEDTSTLSCLPVPQ